MAQYLGVSADTDIDPILSFLHQHATSCRCYGDSVFTYCAKFSWAFWLVSNCMDGKIDRNIYIYTPIIHVYSFHSVSWCHLVQLMLISWYPHWPVSPVRVKKNTLTSPRICSPISNWKKQKQSCVKTLKKWRIYFWIDVLFKLLSRLWDLA